VGPEQLRRLEGKAAEDRATSETQASGSDPIERAVAKQLWRWAFADDETRAEITAVRSDLTLCLEWHLGGLFELIDFTRSRGVWCDGIIEMSIRRLHRRAFLIVGASYSPNNLAPFEIEFHFARRRDLEPVLTVLRFGQRGPGGQFLPPGKRADLIVANRHGTFESGSGLRVQTGPHLTEPRALPAIFPIGRHRFECIM
jgi:hypothetical protein